VLEDHLFYSTNGTTTIGKVAKRLAPGKCYAEGRDLVTDLCLGSPLIC